MPLLRCASGAVATADFVKSLADVIHRFDVTELGIDIEKVPCNGTGHAVADSLAGGDGVEAVGDAVADRLAHAGTGGNTGDHDCVNIIGAQDTCKLGAVEGRG